MSSAFPISAAQRDAIERELKKITENNVTVQFGEESCLRAGLRISIGPWVLRANLADELEIFTHGITHDSDP